MSPESARAPLGRILTFYSYKGGTGRSMALANIAWLLASAGRRVLVIDWDLEAPGLHRYFAPFLIDEEVTGSEGLIDLVDDYSNAAIGPADDGDTAKPDWYLPYTDFSKHVVTVNFRHFPAGGKIDFLPAGRQGDHYALTVSSFNWQNFYDRLGGGGFFEAFKQRARDKYDYVLIDSRTGVSDTAGICSVQMPDSLVVCFTYNNQSIKGAAAIARSAVATHKKLSEERLALRQAGNQSRLSPGLHDLGRGYRVFPVPMRVDEGESERLAIRQRFAQKSFSDFVDHIGAYQVADYWLKVQVPYRVFYAYEEVLAPFKDEAGDPGSVLHAQINLMRFITDGDVADYRPLFSAEEKKKWQDAYALIPDDAAKAAPVTATQSSLETEEELLVRRAEVALASLSQAEQAIARGVLLRLVRISPEEEGSAYFPISTRLNEFRDDEKRIAEVLAGQGVLTITSENRSAEASIGIDRRLFKAWPTLNRWLEEDADFLVWRQQLRASLAAWLRAGRDTGSLLSGRSLNEADLRALRRQDDLSDAELDYIRQSRAGAALVQSRVRRQLNLMMASVAVVVIAAGSWWWFTRPDPTPMVRIPKFSGLSSEEARTLAAQNRLRLVMNDGSSGDQEFIASVVVVSQTPAFDVLAPAMDPVRLSVATATVTVPQLAGTDIKQTLTLLEDSRLKPGATEYRYVPNAIVGQIASQKPEGGVIVPPGTPVDLVVARSPKLNEVQIGIYHLAPEGGLATKISDYLKRKGLQSTSFPREMDFFAKPGRGVPKTNQVRYSTASEVTLKDELTLLLKEGGFGEFTPTTTKSTTDGFISLFLASYPNASVK